MTILDPQNPDHYLVWPKPILIAEVDRLLRTSDSPLVRRSETQWIESVSRLLRAAFRGPGVAEEFDAHSSGFDYGAPKEARFNSG